MTCESCGQQALELRTVQFGNGATETACRRCLEAWALEFGGSTTQVLQQPVSWETEAKENP